MEESISELLDQFEISTSKDCIDKKFSIYFENLIKWNKVINLVSRKSLSLEQHLYDSLQYLKVVPKNGRFLDVGSGAGFPGIPLKIVLPNVRMELLESQRKRANFLKNLIKNLSINDIKVIQKRAEKLNQDPDYIKKYDVVLFRGVGPAEYCLKLGYLFLKFGGILILKKASNYLSPRKFGVLELEKEMVIKGLNKTISKFLVFKANSGENIL